MSSREIKSFSGPSGIHLSAEERSEMKSEQVRLTQLVAYVHSPGASRRAQWPVQSSFSGFSDQRKATAFPQMVKSQKRV